MRQRLFGELLSVAEVAHVLQVHPKTVYEYVKDGRLKAIQLGSGWRVTERALEEFVQKVSATPGPSFWAVFNEDARQAVVNAEQEARRLGHAWIGTEHLVLALSKAHPETSRSAKVSPRPSSPSSHHLVFTELGVDLAKIRHEVEAIVTDASSTTPSPDAIPYTPRGRRVLELAVAESARLGDDFVGSEHVLLGLLAESEDDAPAGPGLAAEVLLRQGVTLESARSAVRNVLRTPDPPSTTSN